MARPGIGDELRALGVCNLAGFQEPDWFDWPPWNEARIRELVAEAHGLTKGIPASETSAEESMRRQASDELDLGGNGYTKEELRVANDLVAREGRLVGRRLKAEADMSWGRARRFYLWFKAGAVRWDKEHGLHPGPGFRWAKRPGDRFTLARSGSR
jgi:hypothetical protein